MDISSMFTVYSILTIVIGAGLLYYGLKWYGTSLAISFFVPSFLMLDKFRIIEQYPTYALGGLIGVALLIFFLARPLTYFVAWLFVCGAQIGLIGAIGFNIEEIPGTIYGWIILGIGIVVVWFIRTQLRAVNIGLAGGSSIALGTSFFIFDLWISRNYEMHPFFPMFWILAWMAAGVVFQYLYIIPRQKIPSGETSSNANDEANVSTSPSDLSPKPDDSEELSGEHPPSDDEKSEDTDISQDDSVEENKEKDESSKG